MNLTTFTSRSAAAVVAGVAGIISYGHIRSVATDAGESELAAALLPLGIDGLIAVAALAFLEDKRAGRRPRLSARGALAFGIVATIGGNVASAEPTWAARAVAAVPAISFLIAVEVLSRTGRPAVPSGTPEKSATSEVANAAVPSGTGQRRRSTGTRTAAEKVAAVRERLGPAATQAEVAKRARVSVRTAARYWRPDQPEPSPNHQQHGDVPELAGVES